MSALPPLPYGAWTETRTTLHLVCQMVGKVRMALHPRRNHWWHVPLYVSGRGLTTRPIPLERGDLLTLDVDMREHALEASLSTGERVGFPLRDRTVAEVAGSLFGTLRGLGVDVTILGRPFDLPFDTPFLEDETHATWDPDAVERFHRALVWSEGVFEAFAGRFLGKQTPVHMFWHSLDLALTRFNGKAAPPLPAEADGVTREAYSHEVVSFGFWAGDPNTPAPAYYAYVYPQPEDLVSAPLEPASARWENPRGRGDMALLMYDDVRAAADPRATLLAFLESAYQGGATRAGWELERLRTSWAPEVGA